jgi:hypothetical protein
MKADRQYAASAVRSRPVCSSYCFPTFYIRQSRSPGWYKPAVRDNSGERCTLNPRRDVHNFIRWFLLPDKLCLATNNRIVIRGAGQEKSNATSHVVECHSPVWPRQDILPGPARFIQSPRQRVISPLRTARLHMSTGE